MPPSSSHHLHPAQSPFTSRMRQFPGEEEKLTYLPADKREFLKISQAVGVGFIVMGVIGYIVKLSALRPPSCAMRAVSVSVTVR